MPLLPVYEWLGLDVERKQRIALNAVGLAIAGFVLVDWGIIHPHVWSNDPSALYWIAKPAWVGVPMLAAIWLLYVRGDWTLGRGLLVSGFIGIVTLQLYYTVIPVPVSGGESIQVGLIGNLTEGVIVHFGGLAVVIVGVLALKRHLDDE